MSERYRKLGRVAHYEHGRMLLVDEAGEALEEDRRFRAACLDETIALPAPDADAVERTAKSVLAAIPLPLRVERLVISAGIAEHECSGRRWVEENLRLHAAIVSPAGLRVLFDRADFDVAPIADVAESLVRCTRFRDAPPAIRLAPPVTAAAIAIWLQRRAKVRLWQRAGGFDGRGAPIERARLDGPPWPNWYRPSYRVRPVRAPFHVEIESGGSAIDDEIPEAIAILAPVTGPRVEVLVRSGGLSYATSVPLTPPRSVGPATTWYPFGAGTYGAAVLL